MANQKSKLSGGAGAKPAVKTAGKSDVKSDVKTDVKTGAKTGAKPPVKKGAKATKPPPIFLPPKPPSIFSKFRTNFLTGLVVVLPVVMTIYLIWAVAGFFDDRILPLIPNRYNPQVYFDVNLRGFGIIVFLVFTAFIGAVVKGFFGRQILRLGEALVARVPIVRSIYSGTKQIVETITSPSSSKFEHACIIQYPRKGIWAVGFVVTDTKGEILGKAGHKKMCSVFLPTTPNPTSGFLLFVPKKDIVLLDMDVESAAKLVISAGLVVPPQGAVSTDSPAIKKVRRTATKR